MKKKGIAVVACSVALALGSTSLSTYAAERWEKSGNNWVYCDSNGNQVTNEWRKGADNLWRYLNSQGVMAVNSWVDDEFYVDNNGIMVIDKWMKLPKKTTGWDTDTTSAWYYFGSSGKVISDGWTKISSKYYYFDSNGAMQTGWVDDNTYYLGDDGSMRTGWIYVADPEDDHSSDRVVPYEDNDKKHWYYFQNNGKKYTPNMGSANYKLFKIDGTYYCFDEDGRMQTGWVNMGDKSDGNFENYRYFMDNGKVKTGWYSVIPPDDDDSNFDFSNDVEWFYFSTSGVPKVGPSIENASTKDLVKINGITYLFNEKGNPVYGLRRLQVGASNEYTAYYFGDKATSSVVKGRATVVEGDGTKYEYYFAESGSKMGRGYTGVKNDYLFYQGRLQKADSGTRYEPILVENSVYLVNTSGKISKNTTVKDASGTKYKTNGSGQITQIDGENNNGKSEGRQPSEPVYWDH